MKILGLDPGTAITGYGLIEIMGNRYKVLDYGCIRTPAHTPPAKRVLMIHSAASRLLEELKPDQIAIEQLFLTAIPLRLFL